MTNSTPIPAALKKTRQTALIILIMSITVGISAALIWMAEDSSKVSTTVVSDNQKTKSTSTAANAVQNLEVPAQQIDPAELRMARTEHILSQMGESSKEVSKSVLDTTERLKMLEELFKEKQASSQVVPPIQALPDPPPARSTTSMPSKSPPAFNADQNQANGLGSSVDVPMQAQPPRRLIYMDRIENEPKNTGANSNETGFAIAGRSTSGSDQPGQVKKEQTESEGKIESVKVDSYVPAASFVKAVLLNGLDAPTGGQAQANPQPIILRLTDLAFLPNRYRGGVKECFVLASGYGDIASERAFLRTDTLSCVNVHGQPIEVKISGYISGEDGKTGMRGRMVTKQGQVLANALLTGSVSALGKILSMTSTTVTENPANALGVGSTTTSITPGKAAQNALGQGLTSAMDKISNYYLKLADQLFPVVEIDAGRQVEVIFTKGFNFGGSTKEESR